MAFILHQTWPGPECDKRIQNPANRAVSGLRLLTRNTHSQISRDPIIFIIFWVVKSLKLKFLDFKKNFKKSGVNIKGKFGHPLKWTKSEKLKIVL